MLPLPHHGGVIDAVDLAIGCGRVKPICHSLHVAVAVQVVKGVLQRRNIHVAARREGGGAGHPFGLVVRQ